MAEAGGPNDDVYDPPGDVVLVDGVSVRSRAGADYQFGHIDGYFACKTQVQRLLDKYYEKATSTGQRGLLAGLKISIALELERPTPPIKE